MSNLNWIDNNRIRNAVDRVDVCRHCSCPALHVTDGGWTPRCRDTMPVWILGSGAHGSALCRYLVLCTGSTRNMGLEANKLLMSLAMYKSEQRGVPGDGVRYVVCTQGRLYAPANSRAMPNHA